MTLLRVSLCHLSLLPIILTYGNIFSSKGGGEVRHLPKHTIQESGTLTRGVVWNLQGLFSFSDCLPILLCFPVYMNHAPTTPERRLLPFSLPKCKRESRLLVVSGSSGLPLVLRVPRYCLHCSHLILEGFYIPYTPQLKDFIERFNSKQKEVEYSKTPLKSTRMKKASGRANEENKIGAILGDKWYMCTTTSLSLVLSATPGSGGPLAAEHRQLKTEHQGTSSPNGLLLILFSGHELLSYTGFWVKWLLSRTQSSCLGGGCILNSWKTALTTWARKEISQSKMKCCK